MIEIRNAVADDVPGLSLLFDSYRVFYQKPTAIELAKAFLKQRIQKKESVIFIAIEEKAITGFVQLYPLFSSTRMKRLWLLNDLFVSPGSRGQGISVALIDRAKDHCRQTNACGLVLETAKTNEIGNRLYPASGFVLDESHNYYSWDL